MESESLFALCCKKVRSRHRQNRRCNITDNYNIVEERSIAYQLSGHPL